ncbi:hypothetical protein QYE76_000300 [Lolium multiflorum]|uniref:CCHC-type domain-containing protein n=1 Tax=Lolium multiflorum TaxID=4521 RepID=A0AAD8RIJ7_LOLMU|nr:hypothetical protein QYE76_000300 [Lolium multiflorum]
MCLTQRLGRRSGDLGGDTGSPSSPLLRRADGRRRGRRSEDLSPPTRPEPAGNRFVPLLSASDDELSEDGDSTTPLRRPSPISLGCFFLGPGLREPSSPARSPTARLCLPELETNPSGGCPPPPSFALGSEEFPPLPLRGEGGRPPACQFLRQDIRIGALSVPLPGCGTAPAAAAQSGEGDLGFPLSRSAVGPERGDRPPLGQLGLMGQGSGGSPTSADGPRPTPSASSADVSHVSLGLGSTVAIVPEGKVCNLDASTPPPPGYKWLWLRSGTLDPDLGFPAPPRDVRRNRRHARSLLPSSEPTSGKRIWALAPMDRDRSYRGKRPFDAIDDHRERSRDRELRQRLEREEEEHRRQQALRDQARDRERSGYSQQRRSDHQQYPPPPPPPPPSGPRGRDQGRGGQKRHPKAPRIPQGQGPNLVAPGLAAGGSSNTPSQDATHITCYNCGNQGHVQAECTAEAFCVKCKKHGHPTAMCASFSKSLDPFWAGFGGQRKGFVCCEVPDDEMYQPATNSALIILEKEGLNEEQLEDELKDLVDDSWAWQVCRLNGTDYSVIFPSKESLRMTIRGGGITLPMSKTKAIVTIPTDDPLVVEKLEEVWVHLIGVPPPLRRADRLLLSTREVGRPIAVDVESLEHPNGPIKMSFGCQAPVQLQEHITLFVNMQGFRIRIVPISKDLTEGTNHDPPSPPARNGEDDKDEDQEETDEDRWDQRRKKHSDKTKNTPASAPVGGKDGFARKSVPLAVADGPCPSPAICPKSSQQQKITLPASAFTQYGSNLTAQGDIFPTMANMIKQVLASPPVSSPRRSGLEQLQLSTSMSSLNDETDEGQSYLTPGKALSLGAEEKKEIGWQSPASGESAASALRASERRNKSNHDRPSRKLMLAAAGSQLFTEEVDNSGKQTPMSSLHQAPAIKDKTATPQALLDESPIPALGATVARAPRSKANPTEAVRKSARSAGVADEPVLARAIRLASDKNATSSATPGSTLVPESRVAPHYIPPPSTFNVLLDSYWFD